MAIQPAQPLPDATFKIKTDKGIEDISVRDLCTGKTVVIFAVPGAFTPTCHRQHLPAFLEKLDELKAKGVDTVACVAVNDPFVLDAWAEASGARGKILMLSDGNATFTRAIGMDFDGSAVGLGIRSKRYAMLVRDGVVEALFVEESPGQCTVSRPDPILEFLEKHG
ncbi:Glutathione amide-dependent peroxidase [bacterium HR39]|nr:Glutathione amide-dependent peroxidase [bacterium HR39]